MLVLHYDRDFHAADTWWREDIDELVTLLHANGAAMASFRSDPPVAATKASSPMSQLEREIRTVQPDVVLFHPGVKNQFEAMQLVQTHPAITFILLAAGIGTYGRMNQDLPVYSYTDAPYLAEHILRQNSRT